MPGKKGKNKGSSARKSPKQKKPLSDKDFRISQMRQKILQFINLKETKKIAIIADNDEDGLTAAVQMKKFLDFSKVESEVFFYNHYAMQLNFPFDHFVNFNPEKTIFLDLSETFITEIMNQLGKLTGPFLVIDHHQRGVIKNNSYRCLVVKPGSFSEIEPSKYPTSKMVNDLFLGLDWIASIGVIGDFAFDQWKEFLQKTSAKHKLSSGKLKELTDLFACITSQYPEKMASFFNFVLNAKKPSDLFESDFFALKKLFDKRLDLLKNLFEENAEYYPDVGLYFFKSDPRFASKLSNIISTKHKDKTIIIYEQPNEQIKCSIRRQDFRVNCNELAKAGITGIPYSTGGGHIPASGASFPPEYFEQFKKQVRLYLLNNPPKEIKQ
jgi:single-stranded DNA-specific DHH superfamily exonuclease